MGDKVTPILEELEIVLSQEINHIILVDDARLFVGKDDYPTIAELITFINNKKPNLSIEIEYDIIRVTQKTTWKHFKGVVWIL